MIRIRDDRKLWTGRPGLLLTSGPEGGLNNRLQKGYASLPLAVAVKNLLPLSKLG